MRTNVWLRIVMVGALAGLAAACAAEDDDEYLGEVTDGKGDAPEIDRTVTLKKKLASGNPSTKTFSVTADADFRVELTYPGSGVTRVVVTRPTDGMRVTSEKIANPTITVDASQGDQIYKVKLENYHTAELTVRLHISPAEVEIPADVAAAARENLRRVSKEIDFFHLDQYGLSGPIQDRFLAALAAEYRDQPDQYAARMKALASMIFFAKPDIAPPANGKLTPFHGLDMAQFDALMEIEDFVFEHHMEVNGGVVGVRPFSVCETRYMIETFVRPRQPTPDFATYRAGYQTFAQSCPQKDLDEWYNFRGLGALRPSWVESNLQDRFLRRMVKKCVQPTPEWQAECDRWNADRLGYRTEANRQFVSRLMYYAPDSQEDYFSSVQNHLVWLEDRNGDGVGDFVRPGPVTLKSGGQATLEVVPSGEFSASLKLRAANGTLTSVRPMDLVEENAVHPDFDPGLLDQPDIGLLALFSDPTGCTGAVISPETCALMKRFFVLIDRHEHFYQTYTALSPDRAQISSQPSPFVACSITLAASHAWDTAGTPTGGNAGFIFLMRIPFGQILAGSDKSVATLSPGPDITSIQDLYAGNATLDLDKVWVDIASLSNNLFQSEHEISKIGAVPAEQIEGILVVRKPAAMP